MSHEVKAFPARGYTTLVISDLHLTEEHQEDPASPLWKKYKTKKFFFDELFSEWLAYQVKNTEGMIELVLNGDIFDFDSVTAIPEKPSFKISDFEKSRTMFSQKEKSIFKTEIILSAHSIWVEALTKFVEAGNRVVFTIGNHDLEFHYPSVQRKIRKAITNSDLGKDLISFCEWFYLSHGDTHIEHGNQYDPYCVCQTPVFPMIRVDNDFRIRIPFGDMTARYMVNAMGFFNPHSEENYNMTLAEYVHFFVHFLLKKQPLIIWTWFYSSVVILYRSVLYRLREPIVDPFSYEERVEKIAKKAQATPRMVRELAALAVPAAVSSPWKIMKILRIDNAVIFIVGILFILQIFLVVDQLVDIQIYWTLIPILFLAPFFIFYSSTGNSGIKDSKDPGEQRLRWISILTGTSRVIFGHTHAVRHELVGSVEYLNPGSWSPIFKDIECREPLTKYAYIKISPGAKGRVASLKEWIEGKEKDYYSGKES